MMSLSSTTKAAALGRSEGAADRQASDRRLRVCVRARRWGAWGDGGGGAARRTGESGRRTSSHHRQVMVHA